MRYKAIKGDHLSKILGPWNVGVRVGNMVFTSGQAAVDSQGHVVGVGDIRAQTRQTIENIKATLETAGADLEDVVSVTIWLTDWRNYEGYNEVYSEYFGPNFPRVLRCSPRAWPSRTC